MRVIICPSPDAVGYWAAEYVKQRIQSFAPTADRPFVLGLPTGSTPLLMYKTLIEFYQRGKLNFQNVITFNLDEYVGLSLDHPQSYAAFMQQHFFSHIDIPQNQIYQLDGMAIDPVVECQAYEDKIRVAGGIDLLIGGVGEDGHIAFNEPGSSLASRTRRVRLSDRTLQSNSRFFDHEIRKVPKSALTVGVGTILEAREVMILAQGEQKAMAVQQAIEGSVNHWWTVSALQLHPQSVIVCDEEATVELKVKTVRYLRGLDGGV
ncbi:MAG: glucosamine-6-phosphate deaminase [Leptolyngbyaceae cyanobacterium SL_7_1]|nr:glucosamine-6-phosphate deaminase [Leptolyngbyaceae cyanobacterium SL_7_1]